MAASVSSNEKHALCGKRVVIIGRMKTMPRRDAVARLEVLGGTNQLKVNTFTDLEPIFNTQSTVPTAIFPHCFVKFFCNTQSITSKFCLALRKNRFAASTLLVIEDRFLVVLPSGEGSNESQLLTDARSLEQAGRLTIIDENSFLEMIR